MLISVLEFISYESFAAKSLLSLIISDLNRGDDLLAFVMFYFRSLAILFAYTCLSD